MPIGSRVTRLLEPQDAYEAWSRAGSTYKAGLWLKKEKNIYNEKTGLPFTHQAIWESSTVFIVNNLQDARKIYNDVMKANGLLPTDKNWYEFILPKIIKLPKTEYNKFMEANSYINPFLQEYLNAKKQSQN